MKRRKRRSSNEPAARQHLLRAVASHFPRDVLHVFDGRLAVLPFKRHTVERLGFFADACPFGGVHTANEVEVGHDGVGHVDKMGDALVRQVDGHTQVGESTHDKV